MYTALQFQDLISGEVIKRDKQEEKEGVGKWSSRRSLVSGLVYTMALNLQDETPLVSQRECEPVWKHSSCCGRGLECDPGR